MRKYVSLVTAQLFFILAKLDEKTPLMDACIKGEVSVVQTLLNQNASVNIADSVSLQPL